MVRLKYIVIEHDGIEAAIVFSPFLLHEKAAAESNIKFAGYCELDGDVPTD